MTLIPLSFEFEQHLRTRAEGFRMVYEPYDPPLSEVRVRCFDTTTREVHEYSWRVAEASRLDTRGLDLGEAKLVEEIQPAYERAEERAKQLQRAGLSERRGLL